MESRGTVRIQDIAWNAWEGLRCTGSRERAAAGQGLVGLGWLRLSRRLFAGYEDVYPLRWENAKAGRLGDASAAPMNGSSNWWS